MACVRAAGNRCDRVEVSAQPADGVCLQLAAMSGAYPASEGRISRAGPASGNRAQMLLQRSVAACVAGRLCSESLKCPAQPKRGQSVRSVSPPRPVATANLHRSGNHWLSCSIANTLGWGSLSGFAHASVRGRWAGGDARWVRGWWNRPALW